MSASTTPVLGSQGLSFNPIPAAAIGVGIACVCLIVLIFGLALGVDGNDFPMLLWASLTILVGLAPVVLDAGRPRSRRHIFLSVLAAGFTVGVVLPIFFHYIPAVGPMDPPAMDGTNVLPHDIAKAQWISLLGLLALYAGYAVPNRQLVQPLLPRSGFEWTQGAAIGATLLLVLTGWFVILGSTFGLIPGWLGSGVLGGIASATTFSSSLLVAIYFRYRSRLAVLLLATIVPATSLINFMTGSKRATLLPIAMVVLTWVILERRIRISWVLGGLLAVVLIYPTAQFWREDVLQSNTLTLGDVLLDPLPAIGRTSDFLASGRVGDYFEQGLESTSRRLDAIGVVSVIVRDTPSVSPFQNGRTLALIPTAYVPRVLWPDKPVITIGQWVTETYVPSGHLLESNLGTTWIGEFYLNWGIPAVLMGMFVLGALLRIAHEGLMRPRSTIPLVVAATIVISQSSLALQGGVVIAVNQPIFDMIPLVLVHLMIRIVGAVRRVPLEGDATETATTEMRTV